MTLPEGSQLGRYKIHSKIGSGGMGEVYLAEDTRLKRRIALKILPPSLTNNRDRVQRFEREARAASALNHPNILTIHEVGEIDSTHFIATELVEGVTLRESLKSSRMRLLAALDVAIEIAGALAAAHAAGIIHRDIKPENVMLRSDGYVKVLDFGLAKLTETETEQQASDPEAPTKHAATTDPGAVMGTSGYMSPEQVRGLTVDGRSDIWSLGVVLYEMVAGRPPFAGGTSADVIARVLERQPVTLDRYAADVPLELQRIASKALAKERQTRYQTVRDMLVDLEALKQELEFAAKLGRSPLPKPLERLLPTDSERSGPGTESTRDHPSRKSTPEGLHSTTGAEAPAVGIKRRTVAILSALVVIFAAVGLWLYFSAQSSEDAIDSIAVLPLVNLNHDPESEYLSDGLTESIINSLTQLPEMRVIARSSVFRYKGKDVDPMVAGRELNVRAVLTGRIMQSNDNLTISVELVDVRDNKRLWGEQYERKVSDLLTVERQIAREISSNLRMKLTGAEESRVTRQYTDSPEAYQLYLKGRFYWNERTADALKKAVEHFNQAISKDRNYALAYAGLADTYVLFPGYSIGSPAEFYEKAKHAARRAIAIDYGLAEAHVSLAGALIGADWNFDESAREFQLAIQLNPNYATAHHWYGIFNRLITGRFDEAVAELKRALDLDPLSLIINTDLGNVYIYSRQYDKAIVQLQKTVAIDQSFYYAHFSLGVAYEMKGRYPEALAEFQKARELNDDPEVLQMLGHAYAASGEKQKARKTLDQLKEVSKQQDIPAYGMAVIYAELGEKDEAFRWLQKSLQDHASDMLYLKIDPYLDNLRSDSRLAELVRKVGL